eukprot:gene27894-33685_t
MSSCEKKRDLQSMVEESLRPLKTQFSSVSYAQVVSTMKEAISVFNQDIEASKACFFDDVLFTDNLMKMLRDVVDNTLDLKKMRIASLFCILLMMSNSSLGTFSENVSCIFTIERLKDLFRGVQDFVGLDFPGNNEKWAVLRKFAEGMCYIRAAVGEKLGKDIVITAVGYYVGHVHSCSGNNPGKMALCYEYIYRCIGQQEYRPKSRSKSLDQSEQDGKARTEMVQRLPELMQAFKPHVDACLAHLHKVDTDLPKKRKIERESSNSASMKLARAPSDEHEVSLILATDLRSARYFGDVNVYDSIAPTGHDAITYGSTAIESTDFFPYYPSNVDSPAANKHSSYYNNDDHSDSENDEAEAFPTHPDKKPLMTIGTKSHKLSR